MRNNHRMTPVWYDEFPPFMVRILARKRSGTRRAPLTASEIASASGRTIRWVNRVSKLDAWDDLSYGEMKAFASACQMDPSKLYRDREYLHRSIAASSISPLAHLCCLPEPERKWMDELIREKRSQLVAALSEGRE